MTLRRQSRDRARAALALVALLAACGGDDSAPAPANDGTPHNEIMSVPCEPDESAAPTTQRCTTDQDTSSDLPPCETWTKVQVDDATCSDGSPYKFFVNFSSTSDNLLIMFEPGGACWDYESCSGGLRGAANPHGIPDDHMSNNQYLNLLRRTDDNPAKDWNLVFVSYCTGDIHVGDKIATYDDPAGGPALTFRHVGLANTQKVVDYLVDRFPNIPRLMITGCSAGGVGAIQQYASIRERLSGTQCGYLLDDSGPVFHGDGPSRQVQAKIREAWNLDTYLGRAADALHVEVADLDRDFGVLNAALAERFPNDRLAFTAYRMDFNYSLYSYERFFPDATPEDIHAMWWQDLQALTHTLDQHPNFAYFIPYFRHDNCSHCVSIPPIGHDTATILGEPWLGSDIPGQLDLHQFIDDLLDDHAPLHSYVQDPVSGEDFTSDELAMCLAPD
jgi:hypothetical protein